MSSDLTRKLFNCYLEISREEKTSQMSKMIYGLGRAPDEKSIERKKNYQMDVENASPEVLKVLNEWITDYEKNCAMANAFYKASVSSSTIGIPWGRTHYVHPDDC
jgi:hypothetical protein